MNTDSLVKTLATGWWRLLLGAVIGALVAGGALLVVPKQYEATARVLVSPAGEGPGTGEQISLVSSMIPTYVALGESDANIALIAERLDGGVAPTVLRRTIGYSPEEDTSIIVVTGRAETPEAAARTTGVAGDVLVETIPQMYDTGIAVDATMLEEAVAPSVPASPDPMIVMPAGVLLGVLGAFWTMVGTGHRRRRPRHLEDLTEATGAPVLGVLDPSLGPLHRDAERAGVPTTMIGVCGRIRRLARTQVAMLAVGSGQARILAGQARAESLLVDGDVAADPGQTIYALIFDDEVARLPASATVVLVAGPETTLAQIARAARFVDGHGGSVDGVVVTASSADPSPSPQTPADTAQGPRVQDPTPQTIPARYGRRRAHPGSETLVVPAALPGTPPPESERIGEDTP